MSKATILLLKNTRDAFCFYVGGTAAAKLCSDIIRDHGYKAMPGIEIGDMDDIDAAEEMFDLTNNPSRQEERVEKYGRGRSVSVGDAVRVNGDEYLCSSIGWIKL